MTRTVIIINGILELIGLIALVLSAVFTYYGQLDKAIFSFIIFSYLDLRSLFHNLVKGLYLNRLFYD